MFFKFKIDISLHQTNITVKPDPNHVTLITSAALDVPACSAKMIDS